MKRTPAIIEKGTEEISTFLNMLLADEYVLFTKTRNAHWNISGPGIYELLKFFEIQYGVIDEMIDSIAERIRSLGYSARGSLKDFLSVTQMSEEDHDFGNLTEISQILLADHERIIRTIQNEIILLSDKYNDFWIVDFVAGLMEQHEKMAWMLRAFLSEPDFSAINHIRKITNLNGQSERVHSTRTY